MRSQPTIPENRHNFVMAFPTAGQSMFPLIKARCRLEIEVLPSSQYRVGEIIVALTEEKNLVAHRIIQRKKVGKKTTFLLKGDFNPHADKKWLSGERFIGRVVKIYYPMYTIDLRQWKHRMLGQVMLLLSVLGVSSWRGWQQWKPRQGSPWQHWYRRLMG